MTALRTALLLSLASIASPSSVQPQEEPATVRVWNRDVVEYRASIGNISPTQRARMAEDRIESLPETALSSKVTTEAAELGDLQVLHVALPGDRQDELHAAADLHSRLVHGCIDLEAPHGAEERRRAALLRQWHDLELHGLAVDEVLLLPP